MAIAVAGFVLTRTAAASNQRMRRADAAEWFRRGGRALDERRSGDAVFALRRASTKNPENNTYALALAAALVADGHDTAASQVLQRLLAVQPELPAANLALARIEGRHGDVSAATRDYQHALTGLWATEREDERRHVRLELIRFLLDHQQHSRALSELLVLGVTMPDTREAHLEAGRLFLEANDPARALGHFQDVLRHEATNRAALAGAGEAAFDLADYARARRFLRQDEGDAHVMALQDLTNRVLDGDPLAPRLPRGERMRRLSAAIAQARAALGACLPALPPDAASRSTLQALDTDASAVSVRIATPGAPQPPDIVEDGMDLAYRIERGVESACGVTAPPDRALLLIGRRHGLDPQ